MKKYNLIVCISLGLSGCSIGIYDDDFDCSPSKGLGCLSVTQVNELVNQGKAGSSSLHKQEKCDGSSCSTGGENHLLEEEKLPRLSGKMVWIAPHYTDEGDHVGGHYREL